MVLTGAPAPIPLRPISSAPELIATAMASAERIGMPALQQKLRSLGQ